MQNLYSFIIGLLDSIPMGVILFFVIVVLPFLILILDDLIYRGYTGLKRGKNE